MSKVIAIHQPQYLPWLQLIDKADHADVFIYLDDVQYQRGGLQNRNRIKTRHGSRMLTVPIKANLNSQINEVRIADTNWNRKHVDTIQQSYARAPYIEWFKDGLRPLLERPWTFLVDLNRAVTTWLFEQFDVDCEYLLSSDLGCEGKLEELVINLCVAAGGDVYLSGQGARSYQNAMSFHRRGILLQYQSYSLPTYPQLHSEIGFISGLSALDLLLNTGPEAKNILRSGRMHVAEASNKKPRCGSP